MESRSRIILQGLALATFIGLAFWLAEKATGNEAILALVRSYGYAGLFLISVVSGFNVVVPIPAASFMPLFIESGLSFFPSVLVIALGMTLADSIAFFLARAGKRMLSDAAGEALLEKFFSFPEKYYRHSLVILFLFAAFAPIPNEVMLVPLALFSGYGGRILIPIVFAGNLLFNILFAKGLLGFFSLLNP